MKRTCPHDDPSTSCRVATSCLCSGDETQKCPVEQTVGERVVFVDRDHNRHCPLKMSFGNGTVCTCPQRSKLFHTDTKPQG